MRTRHVQPGLRHGSMHRLGHRWRACAAAAFALALAPAAAPAWEPPPAAWSATCRVEGAVLTLDFRSVSGAWDMDDMQVRLRRADGVATRLPLARALYVPHDAAAGSINACDRVIGHPLHQGRQLLVLLAENARPLHDQLVALLIDVGSGRLLDQRARLGAIDDSALVGEPVPGNAVRVRLLRDRADAVSDGPEAYYSAWLRISTRGQRLVAEWEEPR